MGALGRSLPRCLAAGFRPPPVEPPTSSRCQGNTSSSSVTCTGGGGGGGQGGEGRAGLPLWTATSMGVHELSYSPEKICLCMCVREEEEEGGWERDGGSGEREMMGGMWKGPASEWVISQFHNVLMWRWCKWPAQGFISAKNRRKQTEDREAPLKEAEPSFEGFHHYCLSLLLPVFAWINRHFCSFPAPPCFALPCSKAPSKPLLEDQIFQPGFS